VRVAADAAGRAYVTDRSAGQVLVFDAFGRPVSVKSGLAGPLAVAVDSLGRIYVAEEQKGSVSVFDAQWNLLFQLGQGEGEFGLPSHIALDPATSTAFVCDIVANHIKTYQGSQRGLVFGGYGSGPGQFDFPAGVWISPAGDVFVVDQNNNRVQVFDRTGGFKRLFSLTTSGGGGGLGAGISGRFQGIAGDSSGRVYVADSFQGMVQVFDFQGNFLSTIGSYGDKRGQFRLPVSLAADSYGRLLVASANNRRIELIGLDSFIQLAATPASQVIAAGTRVTFSVSIAGTGSFTYQWRKGTNNLSDTPGIIGATQATLTLTSPRTEDTGAYSVAVAGLSGPFTSPEATLTVVTPPAIISQPVSQAVQSGTPALLTVAALGDSLTYQWQHDGSPIAGATGASIALAAAQVADAGSYTVLLSNSVGNVTSDPAVLTVVSRPSPPQLDPFSFQPDGSLRLFFHADPGYTYAIEASSDLAQWTTLAAAFSADGTVEYSDADVANISPRFYRVRWLP
jgi:DNA-binding beta-propeller fold protein YncE